MLTTLQHALTVVDDHELVLIRSQELVLMQLGTFEVSSTILICSPTKRLFRLGARLCDWSAKFSSMTYRGQTLAFSLSGLKVSGFGQFVDYQYMLVMLLAIKPYRRIGRKRWGRFVTIWRDEQALGEGVGMKLSTPPWPHAYTHTKTERKYKRALLRLHRHRAWSHQELKWKCSRQ